LWAWNFTPTKIPSKAYPQNFSQTKVANRPFLLWRFFSSQTNLLKNHSIKPGPLKELAEAKSKLDSWRLADKQLQEAITVRKPAMLGGKFGDVTSDGMFEKSLLFRVYIHVFV